MCTYMYVFIQMLHFVVSFLGIDFKVHNTDIDGEKIRLCMWDTPGCVDERYKDLLIHYYRHAVVSWGCGHFCGTETVYLSQKHIHLY